MESVLRRKPQDTSREHIHLSPRMWGTFEGFTALEVCFRFIPTNVGNIHTLRQNTARITVHPHECGEHVSLTSTDGTDIGSSPRMWGTSKLLFSLQAQYPVHPHECGEHCIPFLELFQCFGSSPRMWGTSRRLRQNHS